MKWKKFYILSLAFLPALFVLLCSQKVSADTQVFNYSSAAVEFYTDQQRTATVNLPWSVNPGYNKFWLNSTHADNNSFSGQKLSYLSGRAVLEFNAVGILPDGTTENLNDIYICEFNSNQLRYDINDGPSNQCLGSAVVVNSDNTRSQQTDIRVFLHWNSVTNRARLYFDFAFATEADKEISFIQFGFYANDGYDLLSRTSNWVNVPLFSVYDFRTSIDAYETPPSGADIANDLLQQQIGQNGVMISQNDEIINSLQSQSQQQQDQYDEEKQEESEREESGNESADQMAGVFSFSIQNPFTALFGAFTSGNTCVNIPTIAAMTNSDNTQYCPWFPASVRNVLTPVLSMFSMILIFGFIISWLNGNDANGSITIKGGIK